LEKYNKLSIELADCQRENKVIPNGIQKTIAILRTKLVGYGHDFNRKKNMVLPNTTFKSLKETFDEKRFNEKRFQISNNFNQSAKRYYESTSLNPIDEEVVKIISNFPDINGNMSHIFEFFIRFFSSKESIRSFGKNIMKLYYLTSYQGSKYDKPGNKPYDSLFVRSSTEEIKKYWNSSNTPLEVLISILETNIGNKIDIKYNEVITHDSQKSYSIDLLIQTQTP